VTPEREISERIYATVGDITGFKGDAIVNAANSSLLGGGGVDGAIHRAGGGAILDECRRVRATLYPDGLPPGKAVLTGGGNLGARFVIHTVGPVWRDGVSGEWETLGSCYAECLSVASEREIQSIAFPAVSTGIYGFPKKLAARIAYGTVRSFLVAHRFPIRVVFVFYSEWDLVIFLDSLDTR
jgi:O-acetyl-ADP-ribose deacetylase